MFKTLPKWYYRAGVVKQQNIAIVVLVSRWSPWQSSHSAPLIYNLYRSVKWLLTQKLAFEIGGEEGEKCKPSMPVNLLHVIG